MFDCIIVGSGPAGSTAAYFLARAGFQVLIVEKESLPRYKACSGAVSPSVSQWFDFDFSPAIDQTMRRVRYTWQLGEVIEAELLAVDPIWMVNRQTFDYFLVEQASHQGAEVQDETLVTGVERHSAGWQVKTDKGVYQGRYLIAADGADGPMASWLGFKSPKVRQASVLEIKKTGIAKASAREDAMHFEFGLVKQGCLWNFPKSQGYSIGISAFLGGDVKGIESLLAQYLASEYLASQDLSLGQGQLHHHGLKVWDGNKALHGDHCLLVGEAAAMVDPLTAEGIRPAIISGVKAAESIGDALSGQTAALAAYSQAMHTVLGEDLQWAQRIAGVFFRFPKIGYRVGIKRPSATERLGQILAGEIRYADIANRVIKRISSSFIPGIGR